jgi:16S rRNA (cytidine1402-2'-O)-methyltransferase
VVRDAGFQTIPIPGPSAVTAILSVSGIAGRGWYFEGFLPPKGLKRKKRIAELAARGDPFVLYEGPHRIARLTDEIAETVLDGTVIIGRELTKRHEQIVTGTAREIAHMIADGTIPARGEFVVVVRPGKNG